jgi:arylsulfatase A-like enzyme
MRILLAHLLLLSTLLQGEGVKPNLVFVLIDDLGRSDVGYQGGAVPTPHIDQLAKEGVIFDAHYVAPVCSPTRAGLLTGRYWSRFGVTTPTNEQVLPRETLTLPQALKMVGYDTALIGKWHLGSLPDQGPNGFGFDHSYGSLAGGVGPYDHRYKTGPYSTTWHRNQQLLTEDGHVTDLITDEACDWISQRSSAPFLLYLPYTAVHLPIQEPASYLERVPPSITDHVARQYAACLIHLDESIGRVVNALVKADKRENTLIVFSSDNGGSTAENNGQAYPPDGYASGKLPGNNKPFRDEKGSVYEGGIRVTAFANWPGKLQPTVLRTPLHIVDWMPTFCHLAGFVATEDPRWDGRNLWPHLMGQASVETRPLYIVGPGWKSRALRLGDWKLIQHQKTNSQTVNELYHLERDPAERTNLAEQEPFQLKVMQAALAEVEKADRDVALPKFR